MLTAASVDLIPVNVTESMAVGAAPALASSEPGCCEVEIEIGQRRVRVRGLSAERATLFLRECLRSPQGGPR